MSAILHALIALEAERDRLDTAITALRALAPVAPVATNGGDADPRAVIVYDPPAKGLTVKVAPPRTEPPAKRGRLSNDEKATIARLHRQGTEPEAIAMSLDRPLATVQTAITTMQGEGVL